MGPPLYGHIPFPQMSPLLCEMTDQGQTSRRELGKIFGEPGKPSIALGVELACSKQDSKQQNKQ